MLSGVFLLAACGGDDAKSPKQATKGQKLPEGGVWLAVLRVEDDPNLLDRDTQDLRKPAGKALVVSQVSCFDGLAEQLDVEEQDQGGEGDTTPGTYILGLKADTRSELKRLLNKVDRDAIVITGVTDGCLGS